MNAIFLRSLSVALLALIFWGCTIENKVNYPEPVINSVELAGQTLTLKGAHMHSIRQLSWDGKSVRIRITAQNSNEVQAEILDPISLVVGVTYKILVGSANANTSATQVTVELPQMGAGHGQIMRYNSQLQRWVATDFDGLTYLGSWDASANLPALLDGSSYPADQLPSPGDFYVVSNAGSSSIDGTSVWMAGDWVIFGSNGWERVQNAGGVTSFNGRTGEVLPRANDYELNDLSDVEISGTPSDGQILKYSAGKWILGTDNAGGGGGGGGITSLGGQTGATQTFAVGSSGTAPLWNSSGNAHTLNIPMASGAGVTGGLLTRGEFDYFSAKSDGTHSHTNSMDVSYNGGSSITVDNTNVTYNLTSTADFEVQDAGATIFQIADNGTVYLNGTNFNSNDVYLSRTQNAASKVFVDTYSETATEGSTLILRKSRGTGATPTQAANVDTVGTIDFHGYDGTQYLQAAQILVQIDSTTGTNDMPGSMVFKTTPDGSTTPLARMKIKNNGSVGIGTITPSARLEVSGDATTESGGSILRALSDDTNAGWQTLLQVAHTKSNGNGVNGLGGKIEFMLENSSGALQGDVGVIATQWTTVDIESEIAFSHYAGGVNTPRMLLNGNGATIWGDLVLAASGGYFDYKPNNVACSNGNLLKWNGALPGWECASNEAWTAVTFENSWVNDTADANFPPATYFKDILGHVHVRGRVKSGTLAATAFTLSSGYRPSKMVKLLQICSTLVSCPVTVNIDGTVILEGNNTFLHLDFSFPTQ